MGKLLDAKLLFMELGKQACLLLMWRSQVKIKRLTPFIKNNFFAEYETNNIMLLPFHGPKS